MPTSTRAKMKSFSRVAMELIKREGGKKNLNIAQINEVLAIMCDLAIESPEMLATLILHGQYRANRRAKGIKFVEEVEPEHNGCSNC
mgnify:CR=1 FL=1